jgi:hypothetical protein
MGRGTPLAMVMGCLGGQGCGGGRKARTGDSRFLASLGMTISFQKLSKKGNGNGNSNSNSNSKN